MNSLFHAPWTKNSLCNTIDIDEQKKYITITEIEKIGVKGGKNIGKYIGVNLSLENIEKTNEWERRSYFLFFDRLDSGKNLKNNYESKLPSERNYVRFSLEPDGSVKIWWMHLENSSDISLRQNASKDGVKPSDFILDYFMEYMRKIWLTHFTTGNIKKPFLARLLIRHGFQPDENDIHVEIIQKNEIEGLVSSLEKELSEIEENIQKFEEQKTHIDNSHKETTKTSQRKSWTLTLNSKQQQILQIWNQENNAQEQKLQIIKQIQELQNALEKDIPVVKWYGIRKTDEHTYEKPINKGEHQQDPWFYCHEMYHNSPTNTKHITPFQTSFRYVGSSQLQKRTRNNVHKTLRNNSSI